MAADNGISSGSSRPETTPGTVTIKVDSVEFLPGFRGHAETGIFASVSYGSRSWKTTYAKNLEKPIWKEGFLFDIDGSQGRTLSIGIHDGSEEEVLGLIKLDLARLVTGEVVHFDGPTSIFVDNLETGRVFVHVKFVPVETDSVQFEDVPADACISRKMSGVLKSSRSRSAVNLPGLDGAVLYPAGSGPDDAGTLQSPTLRL